MIELSLATQIADLGAAAAFALALLLPEIVNEVVGEHFELKALRRRRRFPPTVHRRLPGRGRRSEGDPMTCVVCGLDAGGEGICASCRGTVVAGLGQTETDRLEREALDRYLAERAVDGRRGGRREGPSRPFRLDAIGRIRSSS